MKGSGFTVRRLEGKTAEPRIPEPSTLDLEILKELLWPMSMTRIKTSRGLQAGDCFTAVRTFTEAEVRAFADMSRDYNPVHFEPRWTALKRFSQPVCHGLLVGSLLTEIGGQIGWLATSMGFRFRRPVYPGDTVTCRMTLLEIDDRHRARAEAVFVNQRGQTVLEGSLEGIVPGPAEQSLLRDMMAAGDPTNPLFTRTVCTDRKARSSR